MFEAEIKSHTGLEWFQLQQTFTGIPVNPGPGTSPDTKAAGVNTHTHMFCDFHHVCGQVISRKPRAFVTHTEAPLKAAIDLEE